MLTKLQYLKYDSYLLHNTNTSYKFLRSYKLSLFGFLICLPALVIMHSVTLSFILLSGSFLLCLPLISV